MRLDVQRSDDRVVVTVVGQVDTEGGRELSDVVGKLMEDHSVRHAVFDLSGVPAMTSADIGKLLRFYKHFDKIAGSMRIRGVTEPLRTQLEEIHLDRIIPIED